jgi:hypothetical protein
VDQTTRRKTLCYRWCCFLILLPSHFLWGHAPRPPGSASRRLGVYILILLLSHSSSRTQNSAKPPAKLHVKQFLLFQKRSKSVSSASQKVRGYPTLGEADPEGLGACPQQNSTLSHFLLFQKRSKSAGSASQKVAGYPKLGEADPGGLGACPQQNYSLNDFLLF